MRIKLMTFNIQHGRNHNLSGDVIDLDAVVDNVISRGPDIVGINEIRVGKELDHSNGLSDQPRYLAGKFGGDYCFGRAITIFDDCEYGNAVMSKYPISSFAVVPISDPTEKLEGYYYESRSINRTDYDIDGNVLTVLNSHFGLAPNEQTNAVDTVFSIVENIKNPIVLMGDFNMTPDDINIKRLSEYFIDAHASLGKDLSTYPSHSPEDRIDYIFAKGMNVISADTVEKVVSDHFAITAEFEF